MQISTTGEVIKPEMVTRKINIPLIYICTKIFVTASKLLYMNSKSKVMSRLFYTKCDYHFSEFKKPTPPFVIYLTFWGFGHFHCLFLYTLCLMIYFHPQAAKLIRRIAVKARRLQDTPLHLVVVYMYTKCSRACYDENGAI